MSKKKTTTTEKLRPNETKADRFKRVVTPRVSKAVKAISIIGYCAGSTYEFTPEQIVEIGQALVTATDNMIAKYAKSAKSEQVFNFST